MTYYIKKKKKKTEKLLHSLDNIPSWVEKSRLQQRFKHSPNILHSTLHILQLTCSWAKLGLLVMANKL